MSNVEHTNEMIAEESQSNTLDWMKTLNTDGIEMSPIVYLFDEKDTPLLICHLPNQTDDQRMKMLSHFMTTPFINLLPIQAVSVCQDVWFTKMDKDIVGETNSLDELVENKNYVRPSESIDKEQALMTLVIDKNKKGIWSLLEYGRDDKGNIFTKEHNRSVIENWETSDEQSSWIVPMFTSAFDREIGDMVDFSKEEELSALLQAFTTLHDMDYSLGMRTDISDVIIKHYANIMDDEKANMLRDLFDKSLKGDDDNG